MLNYSRYKRNPVLHYPEREWPNKEIEKAHINIIKVERIVEEFQMSLDRKYPVAQDFENIYVYLSRRLIEANVKKDKEILAEVTEHLRSLRDTWKEVMRINNVKG